MRVIVMGQQAFGQAALEKILEAGQDEVIAVYTAPDKEGKPVDPLKQAALDHGLPLYQPSDFKDEDVLAEMRALNADVMMMAYVIVFVPEEARDIPKMGSICFHPSLLPLHRGPSSINWPIIWGSTKSGLSWFYPTDGLDEGEILLQKKSISALMTRLGIFISKKFFHLVLILLLRFWMHFAQAILSEWRRMKPKQLTKAGAVKRTPRSIGHSLSRMCTT